MNLYQNFTGRNFKVSGSFVEGYQPVREAFEQNFRDGLESRAQLCVYVNQEKVIGLYSTFKDFRYLSNRID